MAVFRERCNSLGKNFPLSFSNIKINYISFSSIHSSGFSIWCWLECVFSQLRAIHQLENPLKILAKYLWRWWSSRIHIMSPSSAFVQRCSTATIWDLDADIIFAFCHQDFDWWRIDRTMKFDCCSHWIFEKFETDVMKMRWNISHFNIVPVFMF